MKMFQMHLKDCLVFVYDLSSFYTIKWLKKMSSLKSILYFALVLTGSAIMAEALTPISQMNFVA